MKRVLGFKSSSLPPLSPSLYLMRELVKALLRTHLYRNRDKKPTSASGYGLLSS